MERCDGHSSITILEGANNEEGRRIAMELVRTTAMARRNRSSTEGISCYYGLASSHPSRLASISSRGPIGTAHDCRGRPEGEYLSKSRVSAVTDGWKLAFGGLALTNLVASLEVVQIWQASHASERNSFLPTQNSAYGSPATSTPTAQGIPKSCCRWSNSTSGCGISNRTSIFCPPGGEELRRNGA